VRDRLVRRARDAGQDPSRLLVRYAGERLLYRLSISPHAERFLLKGALLFDLWFDTPYRPTRDVDLLGIGSADVSAIRGIFSDLCLATADDGVTFLAETVQVEDIRQAAMYAGMRVTMLALIASARCPLQVDIGFGDAVTPEPELARFPTLLPEFDAPLLRVYPRETVVAEKLEAIVLLGTANSRMKDFFDLWVLSQSSHFDGEVLSQAIRATFARRRTPLPKGTPFGLTDAFAGDQRKQDLWDAFLKRNRLEPLSLHVIISVLRAFVEPLLDENTAGVVGSAKWPPRGPWIVVMQ